MKKILALSVLCLSAQVFAQEFDVDEINQRNGEQINSEYSMVKTKRWNHFLQNAGKNALGTVENTLYAIGYYLNIEPEPFPPKKTYSGYEADQIGFLSCLRSFVQNNEGGYDSPALAAQLIETTLTNGKMSQDSGVLKKRTEDCKNLAAQLNSYKDKALDKDKLYQAFDSLHFRNKNEMKVRDIVFALGLPQYSCKMYSVEAEAYAVVGGGANIHNLKCLGTDGRMRNYLGVGLVLGLGLGAYAGVASTNTNHLNDDVQNNVAEMYSSIDGIVIADTRYALILGKKGNRNEIFNDGGEDSLYAGLGIDLVTLRTGSGFRFFNGKSRWQDLLELVNK